MKKILALIITVVLVASALFLIIFFSERNYYGEVEYNQELLNLSQNFDSKQIALCEEIPIEKIAVPNWFLMSAGRPFFYFDIDKYIKIENVQQTKYGFNIIFKTQNQTMLIATGFDGHIRNMAYFGDDLYKASDYFKVKNGMTLDEVKKLLPGSYIFTHTNELVNFSVEKLEKPYIEIVCKSGTVYQIDFVEKNGVYYVENDYSKETTYSGVFTDDEIIKSWKKLIKDMSKT